jgi:hypothetical protein
MAEPSASYSTEPSPRAILYGLVRDFWMSRVLWVAAKLGLADLLVAGARDSADLARATGTHPPTLHRVLRALCAVGALREDDAGRFALTPVGATLRSDRPDSMAAWVTLALGDEHYDAWGDLLHSVRTGEVAFEHRFGEDVWTYRARHTEHARVFDDAMARHTGAFAVSLVASYSFATVAKLVDVGGGDGALVEAILRTTPEVRAVLLELPHVAPKARERMRASGLEARCDVVDGNMLQAVPKGGDAYVLSRVIHDWADEPAVTILRNCRRAMPPGSRLLVIERLLPERGERGVAAEAAVLSDLLMMVMNGGRERTEGEYGTLFSAAGLRHRRTIQTRGEVAVLEAVPDSRPTDVAGASTRYRSAGTNPAPRRRAQPPACS